MLEGGKVLSKMQVVFLINPFHPFFECEYHALLGYYQNTMYFDNVLLSQDGILQNLIFST